MCPECVQTSPRMTLKWFPTASQVRPMVPFAAPVGQGCVHNEPLYRIASAAFYLLRDPTSLGPPVPDS